MGHVISQVHSDKSIAWVEIEQLERHHFMKELTCSASSGGVGLPQKTTVTVDLYRESFVLTLFSFDTYATISESVFQHSEKVSSRRIHIAIHTHNLQAYHLQHRNLHIGSKLKEEAPTGVAKFNRPLT